jgi:hypothetical protein
MIDFLQFSASPRLKDSVSLFEHFQHNGYSNFGTGKWMGPMTEIPPRLG